VILGLSLARGGSKGLHRKNIAECAGKPLLQWTIEAAKASKKLNRYIVSTDDPGIGDFAESLCVEVKWRPNTMAGDNVNRLDVILDLLKWHKDLANCNVIVLLQPTSPVRLAGLIDECIEDFEVNNYDTYHTGFWRQADQFIPWVNNRITRQTMPRAFYDDGNIYIARRENLMTGNPGNIGTKILSEWENVEVDSFADLKFAEAALLCQSTFMSAESAEVSESSGFAWNTVRKTALIAGYE